MVTEATLEKIQPYDLYIMYAPGPKVQMAGALSRVSHKVETKAFNDTFHKLTPQLTRVQVQTNQKAATEDNPQAPHAADDTRLA